MSQKSTMVSCFTAGSTFLGIPKSNTSVQEPGCAKSKGSSHAAAQITQSYSLQRSISSLPKALHPETISGLLVAKEILVAPRFFNKERIDRLSVECPTSKIEASE